MTFTLPDNSTTTMAQIYVWANNTTNGAMGYGILLMTLAMVFLGTKRFGATTSDALMNALLTTSFVCAALTIMGVTNQLTLGLILVATAILYIYTYHN